MVDDTASSVRVPDGFSVALHGVPPMPSIEVLASGLILAHFGCGSDDPAGLVQTIERARSAVERDAEARPLFATRARGMQDLLGQEPPATAAAMRPLLWTCRGDALRVVLDGGRLEAGLVAELAALPSLGLVVDESWGAGDGIFGALRAANVAVWQAGPGAPFLVEVSRPEGTRVHSLTVPDAPPCSPRPRVSPVWTSPRLRWTARQAIESSSHAPLQEALSERAIPLVFIVGSEGSPMLRTWPDAPGPVLPVFGDLESLHRSAEEIGLRDEQYQVGALMFATLMELAHAQGVTVALGVFDDEGAASYVPFATQVN